MSELNIYQQPEVILILDLETLASDTDKAVVWWACLIGYDVAKEETIPVRHDQFYPIQPQLDRGRIIEADTMLFWMSEGRTLEEIDKKILKEYSKLEVPCRITTWTVEDSDEDALMGMLSIVNRHDRSTAQELANEAIDHVNREGSPWIKRTRDSYPLALKPGSEKYDENGKVVSAELELKS